MNSSVRVVAITHARALWRRRWYAIGVAWLVCLAGWTFVMRLPNVYEAKARVYVDTDSMLLPLMRGLAVDSNILSQVDLMQRTLLSTPNLQKVSHAADLDIGTRSAADSEALISSLRSRIAVTGEGRNLFSLSYTGPDRAAAVKVVQSLVQVFVESNIGSSRQDIASTRAFIESQIREYAAQLDSAEAKMAQFKATNMGFLPGDENYSNKLDLAKQQVEKTQAELEERKQQREAIIKQLSAVPQTVETISNGSGGGFGAGPPLDVDGPLAGPGGASSDLAAANARLADTTARVSDLEKKLNNLLENYTPQHPDVLNIKRLIEIAKKDREEARAEQRRQADKVPKRTADAREIHNTAPNPVYEQLQLQLAALEGTIASLEARLQRNQGDVAKWAKLARTVPEVGAEMSKLTRDYNSIKSAYEQMVARREQAKIGSDMTNQTQTVQFRIIDPPTAPAEPVAPKRLLLQSVVFIGGIGAGIAFAFLLTQIDDSVMNLRQLKEAVAVPVLGAISLVADASRRRRFGAAMAGFVAACVGLMVVYVGIMAAETLMRLHA